MSDNIFTGYLSVGKWYYINRELSQQSLSVLKVKICLELGEILTSKVKWSFMPRGSCKMYGWYLTYFGQLYLQNYSYEKFQILTRSVIGAQLQKWSFERYAKKF